MNAKTILIRGEEYLRLDYDWYIDEALRLAPQHWTYEQIVCLRDLVRENHNHSLGIPLAGYEGKSRCLKKAIQQAILDDPSATIRYVKETLGVKWDRVQRRIVEEWMNER
ncbi:MAG: hypothetical protein BroJett011_62220 [Chloroflexota bacterium]|nr:MAG: hypothetical protein BroJett011_62220 [Chloroflexota bacterium]